MEPITSCNIWSLSVHFLQIGVYTGVGVWWSGDLYCRPPDTLFKGSICRFNIIFIYISFIRTCDTVQTIELTSMVMSQVVWYDLTNPLILRPAAPLVNQLPLSSLYTKSRNRKCVHATAAGTRRGRNKRRLVGWSDACRFLSSARMPNGNSALWGAPPGWQLVEAVDGRKPED